MLKSVRSSKNATKNPVLTEYEVRKMQENVYATIDLRDYGRLLLKRIWIIVLCVVLLGAAPFVYTKVAVDPMYEARISVYVNNSSQKGSSYVSSSDLAVARVLAETYVNIIQSDRVLDQVIQKTGINAKASQLRGLIEAEPVNETEMFQVVVTTPNAQLSADLANTIAEVAPGVIGEIIEGSSAKIIDFAKVPENPASPNATKNAVVGALVGLILAAILVFLEMVLDTRIQSQEDLMRISQIPMLGSIPNMNENAGKKKKLLRR
jgi:capsular polysaccharide biosynthesis protein